MATELKSQVFLSFKGKDTGNTFADHLYEALLGAGFATFRSGDENERREEIKLELQKGIKESGVSIIIFSNDYVSSSLCLDELVMILDCKRISRRAVLPIFYHVDPSDVRKQKGRIGEAFDRHESGNEWKAMVRKWREALKEVADLGGMVLQNQAEGHESKFIQKILKVVENKLSRPVLYVCPHLIGIERRVEKINSWLEDESIDVDTLVISGFGGIGKTTMAKYVYNLNFSKFDGSSFLSKIRENSTHRKGLVTLQRQFLSDICKRKQKPIFSVDEGMAEMRNAASCKRILLVLDDVDNRDQLDALLEMKDLLYPGSKVIVTTRNKRLLRPFDVHKLYEIEALNRDESVELLSWHAFGQHCPIKGFEVFSEQVAIHCGGLPLALEVLGATLAGRNMDIWRSTIQKLETIPNHQIIRKLTISYESLEDDHDKNLFLHLACFFFGEDRDLAIAILNRCNFYTVIGIENLIDRNFIKVSTSNRLIMHQMIRDMGRDIVRQESPAEPGKRSRLWRSKDSFNVLIQNRATQTIQGIILDMDMLMENDIVNSSFSAIDFKKHKAKNFLKYSNPERGQFKQKRFGFSPRHLADAKEVTNELILETDVFANMQKLRLLQFDHVELQGSFDVFPKRLRWLRWSELQLECMPIDFPLESLVVIELQRSSLRKIWHGVKFLKYLKIFDLSHSYELLRTPDFSGLPNLEKLILRYCTSLIELHETIGCLESLTLLNLKNCKNLQRLPDSICMLKCLETLNISGCSNLEYVLMDLDKMDSLRELYADEIAVHEMISTAEEVQPWYGFLRSWMWKGTICPEVSHISLPNSLVTLSLAKCNLSDDAFPVAFGSLSLLQNLDLSQNKFCSLPKGITYLTRLQKLEVESCEKLKSLLGLPSIEHLNVTNCRLLEKISYQSKSSRLKDLLVSNCVELVEIDGNFKLEPLRNTEAEMLCKLGLWNLAPMDNVMINLTSNILSYYRIHGKGWTPSRKTKKVVLQGLYQPGVFSTFLPGEHVRSWFSSKFTNESRTSFKVPTCNSRIEGLSFCIVYKRSTIGLSPSILRPPRLTPSPRIAQLPMRKAQGRPLRYRPVQNKPYESTFDCPCITVNNLTRSLKWSYQPLFYGVPEGKKGMMWLSHWKLENQLSSDDGIEVTVTSGDGITVMEFGIKILHGEEPKVLGEPSCEDASGERDIVNPFWDDVLGDTSSKNTCSVRLPPTYRSIRAAHEPFMEMALKRNMSDCN
ncbi:disease resistance protein RUN1-like isoform X1 [Lycium ferocissimum]|uniref:disease resistance protein RUN1-like isoform X1 n=1 Tax=Lycium ferocissimum TaxID=112874 RepID=UPI0028167B67|nr:disease resistance protein RUN1-like isoform X1 [Lycium ferocissimum]